LENFFTHFSGGSHFFNRLGFIFVFFSNNFSSLCWEALKTRYKTNNKPVNHDIENLVVDLLVQRDDSAHQSSQINSHLEKFSAEYFFSLLLQNLLVVHLPIVRLNKLRRCDVRQQVEQLLEKREKFTKKNFLQKFSKFYKLLFLCF
jgi:hypothetical protein